jgi:hypothetical protein
MGFSNVYTEFVEFLNSNVKLLTTDINDAVYALHIFKKYVYDNSLSKS